MKNTIVRNIRILACVVCTASVLLLFGSAQAADDEVKKSIEQKNKELQQIQQQVREQQKKLQETQQQKKTLSSEVTKIDTTIKQINLGIQSSEVLIERLGLEEQSLSGDISDAEREIREKETAVGELLRKMQEHDNEGVLITLLKNNTLSDGLVQVQTLADMQEGLLVKIDDLQGSKNKLSGVLKKTLDTKNAKEDEYENLKNKKVIASELRSEKSSFLSQTKKKETEYQQSLKDLEAKQLEIALEIEKMEAALRSQIKQDDLPESSPGTLVLPVVGTLTQSYGATTFAQRAYKGKWHNGLDFGAPIGTSIFAAEGGVVVGVDNQDLYCNKGAYGKYVAIRHTNGLTTLYGHLSMYVVKEGDRVKRGQIIGYVGKTGYATGPHLHFTVYDTVTFRLESSRSCGPKMPIGGDLDPRKYLPL